MLFSINVRLANSLQNLMLVCFATKLLEMGNNFVPTTMP